MTTNELLFPCSYFYFIQFYGDRTHRVEEVLQPNRKVLGECFASKKGKIPPSSSGTYVSTNSGAHGTKGLSLLFVDGHSQFATYKNLLPTTVGFYNFDWTLNGLAGVDLK
jgi:hypothetical protein